jgi:hypothetical protein
MLNTLNIKKIWKWEKIKNEEFIQRFNISEGKNKKNQEKGKCKTFNLATAANTTSIPLQHYTTLDSAQNCQLGLVDTKTS